MVIFDDYNLKNVVSLYYDAANNAATRARHLHLDNTATFSHSNSFDLTKISNIIVNVLGTTFVNTKLRRNSVVHPKNSSLSVWMLTT